MSTLQKFHKELMANIMVEAVGAGKGTTQIEHSRKMRSRDSCWLTWRRPVVLKSPAASFNASTATRQPCKVSD